MCAARATAHISHMFMVVKLIIDLKMEHAKTENGINWTFWFNFDFHFTDTSSHSVNAIHGSEENALTNPKPSTSKTTTTHNQLDLRISATPNVDSNVENCEIEVTVGDNGIVFYSFYCNKKWCDQ